MHLQVSWEYWLQELLCEPERAKEALLSQSSREIRVNELMAPTDICNIFHGPFKFSTLSLDVEKLKHVFKRFESLFENLACFSFSTWAQHILVEMNWVSWQKNPPQWRHAGTGPEAWETEARLLIYTDHIYLWIIYNHSVLDIYIDHL